MTNGKTFGNGCGRALCKEDNTATDSFPPMAVKSCAWVLYNTNKLLLSFRKDHPFSGNCGKIGESLLYLLHSNLCVHEVGRHC